jgi:cyclohexanone monooxygenase
MTTDRNGRHAVDHDVLVVGAGFAGLYLLHKLRGLGFSVRVVDAAPEIGGTWFWNRYPGARCDIESMQYSYSFDEDLQQEWCWSERFATQPEILQYINHVADRFDLRGGIDLNTKIVSALFDAEGDRWSLRAEDGRTYAARFCIMATGCLSAARVPDLPGLADYQGHVLHTADWPREGVDLSGRTVGVVGTGSSAIQAIPHLADQARHLYVFQRTPNFSVPARNAPLSEDTIQSWKRDYPALRRRAREETRSGTIYEFSDKGALEVDEETRRREYERRWIKGGANFMHAFNDILIDEGANRTAADFVREKIRATVRDQDVAAKLLPTDHPLGAKRICVDADYYETFNRSNVTLVDLRAEPIERVTATGLRTPSRTFDCDCLVFATGFDAMTGALTRIEIRGETGQTLKEVWTHGPKSYLGLMIAGFPNLFTITGPGSPSVLSNVIVSIEQHVEWVAGCLRYMRDRSATRIEAGAEAQEAWMAHVDEVAQRTLYPRAKSWYMGANIEGKPQGFMPYIGGVGHYRAICAEKASQGYEGFLIS